MTHQHVSRTNQQSKSDTPLVRGILQRAAVRNHPEKEVEPTQEVEATTFREPRFHHNFSQVPASTGTESVIQAKGLMQGQVHKKNKTGLPDNLKEGIENLSGMAMDDVKVHYNSSKPSQLEALAYTQGTDIHVAPGQEKHLPHEAWHVVQQKQGRVKPSMQMKGVQMNDEVGLEREADVKGRKAYSQGNRERNNIDALSPLYLSPTSNNKGELGEHLSSNGSRTLPNATSSKVDGTPDETNSPERDVQGYGIRGYHTNTRTNAYLNQPVAVVQRMPALKYIKQSSTEYEIEYRDKAKKFREQDGAPARPKGVCMVEKYQAGIDKPRTDAYGKTQHRWIRSNEMDNELPEYAAGHMLPNEFGGQGDPSNVFEQEGGQNSGSWRGFEIQASQELNTLDDNDEFAYLVRLKGSNLEYTTKINSGS